MKNFVITITEKQWEDMRDEADACLYLPQFGGVVKVEPLDHCFTVFTVNAHCDHPHLADSRMRAVARAGDRVVICLCQEENVSPESCSHD